MSIDILRAAPEPDGLLTMVGVLVDVLTDVGCDSTANVWATSAAGLAATGVTEADAMLLRSGLLSRITDGASIRVAVPVEGLTMVFAGNA